MSDYALIADHGLIGDLQTSALVATDGSVDWFCAPRFDSPSVFGALLDHERGGAWTLGVVDGPARTLQFYVPETNILVTRFLTEEGVAEVHDFMPILEAHDADHRQRLVRRVVAVRGEVTLRTCLTARPDYGRAEPVTTPVEGGVLIEGDGVRLGLTAASDLELVAGSVAGQRTLSP